eukprot:scaffold13193_cov92-Amphora_coffeaeformis.AAC.2
MVLNRSGENTQKAIEKLQEDMAAAITGEDKQNTAAVHHLVDCDLLSFHSVHRACQKVKELTQQTGIDILCNNAGIMLQPDEPSQDGYDITASTNVLSHFLMTRELLPGLERAAQQQQGGQPSRVIHMSSASGYGGPALDTRFFEPRGGNLGGARLSYERYHQRKLANLVFTAALHDRLLQNDKNT